MDTLVEEKRSALGLYGGKDAVLERMNHLFRDKLKMFCNSGGSIKERLDYLESECGMPEEVVHGILGGQVNVDFKLFEQTGEAIGLDIHTVLGAPEFKDQETTDYWTGQTHEFPMAICGPRGGGSIDKYQELRFYVKLRAIGELVLDK